MIPPKNYKEFKAILRLQIEADKSAKEAEEEYQVILEQRYYDEHPLDGNANYARMQGDDRGAIGETEPIINEDRMECKGGGSR